MKLPEIQTNNLMILGGGLVQPEPGAPFELRTTARAKAALYYYEDHAKAFMGEGAMILCSGGGSLIYDAEEASQGLSEASLTADWLMARGVPAGLIETETNSTTSTLNFVESVESGLLVPSNYSPANPLGVVTHRNNYWRIKEDIRDVGFAPNATVGIHPEGRDPAVSDSFAKEVVASLVRKAFFGGVEVGDLAELRRRNQLLENAIAKGAGGLLRGMASAMQNK